VISIPVIISEETINFTVKYFKLKSSNMPYVIKLEIKNKIIYLLIP